MSYLISLILKDEGLSDSNDSNNTEAVVRRCSVKKVYLEISQNSQEKTCARFSFLIKLQAWRLQLYWKRDSGTGVFL